MPSEKQISLLKRIYKKKMRQETPFKYPLKAEDRNRMPFLRDTKYSYECVENAYYKNWRKNLKNKKFKKGFYIRDFQKIWKLIAEKMIQEITDNVQGIQLPDNLGTMYLGTPANKNFHILDNRPNQKFYIWGNSHKYARREFKFYFFRPLISIAKSAILREGYYKTSKEKPYIKSIYIN